MLLFTVTWSDGATALDKSDLLSELKILKEINKEPHPNVLELIGACSTSGNPRTSNYWFIQFLPGWYHLNYENINLYLQQIQILVFVFLQNKYIFHIIIFNPPQAIVFMYRPSAHFNIEDFYIFFIYYFSLLQNSEFYQDEIELK